MSQHFLHQLFCNLALTCQGFGKRRRDWLVVGLVLGGLLLFTTSIILVSLRQYRTSRHEHLTRLIQDEERRLQFLAGELQPLLYPITENTPALRTRVEAALARYAQLAPPPVSTILVDRTGPRPPIIHGPETPDFKALWPQNAPQAQGPFSTPGGLFIISPLQPGKPEPDWQLFSFLPAGWVDAGIADHRFDLQVTTTALLAMLIGVGIATLSLHRQRLQRRLQAALDRKIAARTAAWQAREAFNATTFATSPNGVCVLDAQGRILRTNAAWQQLAARWVTPAPPPGKGDDYCAFCTRAAHRHPENAEAMCAGLRALGQGQLECFEIELTVGPEDQPCWILLRAVPFAEGETRRLIVAHTDITELKRTQQKLLQLSQVIDQVTASIIITDTTGRIEYVNPAFTKNSGYSAAEAIGRNPRLLKSGQQPGFVYQELWATISAGRCWKGELHNRRKDGELYWDRVLIEPLRDAHDRITHYVAVNENITDNKRTEQSLTWIKTLFDHTADICCVKDLNLRVVAANQAFARALGKASAEELLGRTDAEIFGLPEDQEPIRGFMDDERRTQRLRLGEQIVREEIIPYANGQIIATLTNKFPVFNAMGRLIATANISTDITSLKKTEKELLRAKETAEAASRAKSAFLTNMSHELRTPLNTVNGIAATLAEQALPADAHKAARLIQQGGQNLLGIIEEILDYTGIQTGQVHLEKQPFSLPETLLTALRMVNEPLRNKGVKLDYWVSNNTPSMVVGDARRLQQILRNLLANTVKFTERGRVHLHLETQARPDGHWALQFSVMDTGVGISPERLPDLFQPFNQEATPLALRRPGAGLGLSIAQSLAHLMGGGITARSQPNRGSVFRFTVSVERHLTSLETFVGRGPATLAGKRALLIESDPVRRTLLSDMLRTWNIEPVLLPPHQLPTYLTERVPPCEFALIDQESIPLRPPHWQSPDGTPLRVLWLAHTDPSRAQQPDQSVLVRPFAPADLAEQLVNLLAHPTTPNRPREHKPLLANSLPLRILAADDIATNREALRMILRHLGYEAQLVENGAEVLHQLYQRIFDLVILDVQMPVMDGLTAAREICRLQPDPTQRPKLIALTANALAGDCDNCLAAGMDAYLSKPLLPRKLETSLLQLFPHGVDSLNPHPLLHEPAQHEPWIDQQQLDSIVEEVEAATAVSLLNQLFLTFQSDYQARHAKLQQVSAAHDPTALVEIIHGLKGGALMLGWSKFSAYCVTALTELRQNRFQNWAALPAQLQALYERSSSEMDAVLTVRAQLASLSAPIPTPPPHE